MLKIINIEKKEDNRYLIHLDFESENIFVPKECEDFTLCEQEHKVIDYKNVRHYVFKLVLKYTEEKSTSYNSLDICFVVNELGMSLNSNNNAISIDRKIPYSMQIDIIKNPYGAYIKNIKIKKFGVMVKLINESPKINHI